ncbi:hypothetical protein CWB65_19805, partial [Pseudoalteromonas sp. S554]
GESIATPLQINVGRITQLAGFELVRMLLTKRGLIALAAFALVCLILLLLWGLLGDVALRLPYLLIVAFNPVTTNLALI